MSNCSNNGVCAYQGNQTYGCNCTDDFIGRHCQTDKRPCRSWPCTNNGTCSQTKLSSGSYNFTCSCLKYYSGSRCEKFDRAALCGNLSCVKGFCLVDKGKAVATCSCFVNYYGARCENASLQVTVVRWVTNVSLVVSLVLICLFYLTCVVMDLKNGCFCCKNKTKTVKKGKPKRAVYKNSSDETMHARFVVKQLAPAQYNTLNLVDEHKCESDDEI
jgi:hypothetical protein